MHIHSCPCSIRYNEMNISGILPSDKLPIFLLKPTMTPRHACLASPGDKTARVYASQKTGTGLQVWLQISGWRQSRTQRQSRTRSQVRCWTCERAYSGYEIGLEVTNAVSIQLVKCNDFISCVSRNYSRKHFMRSRKAGAFCTCGIRKIEKVGIKEKRFGK